MSHPSETEQTALTEAWCMLRYVTITKPEVDQAIVNAIVDCQDSLTAQKWTPDISKTFWPAYTKLSSLIQPVTIDCLIAAQRNHTAIKFPNFWRGYTKLSSGEKTSQGYVLLLFFIIVVTVISQFYVTRYADIVANIDKSAATLQAEMAQLNADYATVTSLQQKPPASPPSTAPASPPQIDPYVQIINDSQQIISQTQEIQETEHYLDSVSIIPFPLQRNNVAAGQNSTILPLNAKWPDYYGLARGDAGQVQEAVNQVDVKAISNNTGISIFLLPILYSTIGALAYILRTISSQLKSITFSQNSPIRHAVRLFLGVMMGLVVGAFSTVTTDLNLQPLAIAFLAGYGVEVFFSTFDSIIDRFKTQQLEPPDGTPKGKPVT